MLYIHNNPVYHGFCDHPIEYGWSSYIACTSNKPTKLKRAVVIDWFNDLQNFKECHNQALQADKIDEWLGI
ncbi:hypothetical protein [Marinifilum sp. D714]|uniref:hypothetical protein n=1 Tax=Marinifilum sp. D714 TaxID=2937523 RepID=UPI0027C2C7D8|nr:hypothetical protein [Marinifilum sp. D714]MDQ2179995.1 hypothetical protein [Marinifilum sp. D714]